MRPSPRALPRVPIASALSIASVLSFTFAAAAQGVSPDPALMGPAPATEDEAVQPAPPAVEPVPLDVPAEHDDEYEGYHKGFFFRLALGLGWGWLEGKGTLPAAKGLRMVEDFSHDSPLFNFALSLGGGFLGLALHLDVLYERLFLRSDDPIEMGVTLMGVGGGLSYYFSDYDFFATAQVRLTGMMTFMPQVVCEDYYADKFEWYRGPGFSLTLGKEWYDEADDRGEEDEGGIGLGLQGNYARLTHDNGVVFNYFSLLLVLTVSHF
jgi:hypothetical protein